MSLRDHSRERGWFGHRYQPPIPVPVKIAPAPAPATPPPPEPDPITVQILRMWWLSPDADDWDETPVRDPAHVYRFALINGWGTEGAGLWAAYVAGIPLLDEPVEAWTLKQVRTLVFLRETYERWA